MKRVCVRELLEGDTFKLNNLTEQANLEVEFSEKEVNRPGLALSGYLDYFANKRIQIFGNSEWSYLLSLKNDELEKHLKVFFDIPLVCLVFTHGHHPPELFIKLANQAKVATLVTTLSTVDFIDYFKDYIDRKMAPRISQHGVLIEVFGVGILISGPSGVGKSETALALVERGHRLVADDMIEIVLLRGDRLYGHVSDVTEHHMEIRGLGVINIKDLFGAGSVRKSKRVDLVIKIEYWQKDKEYDRLGLNDQSFRILGVDIPALTIPVQPGRNVPIIIETAAKNFCLKQMGVHAARTFNKKLVEIMNEKLKKGM